MAFNFNFFKTIEDRYKIRISLNKPIVIRLDGKNVCKNPSINLVDDKQDSFSTSLNNTARALSRKFNSICISSTDEINIIITNTSLFYKYYGSIECQKISSFVAQEVFSTFNNLYSGEQVLFDARTFNIPENKIQSYLTYRTGLAKNVYTIYYAKRLLTVSERIDAKIATIDDLLNRTSEEYRTRPNHFRHGAIYFDGLEIPYNSLPSESLSTNNLLDYLSSFEEPVIIEDSAEDLQHFETQSDTVYEDFLL